MQYLAMGLRCQGSTGGRWSPADLPQDSGSRSRHQHPQCQTRPKGVERVEERNSQLPRIVAGGGGGGEGWFERF